MPIFVLQYIQYSSAQYTVVKCWLLSFFLQLLTIEEKGGGVFRFVFSLFCSYFNSLSSTEFKEELKTKETVLSDSVWMYE